MMNGFRLGLVALLLLLVVGGVAERSPVGAQEGDPCPRPSILFDPRRSGPVRNYGANLVADQTGKAHLVWLNYPEERDGATEDIYYYSRWDGQGWTAPVDIFAGSSELQLGWPELVPAPDGRLHIFWPAWYAIVHSWAWASAADSAQAWSPPQVVTYVDAGVQHQIGLKLDGSGSYHVVYAAQQGDVYYIRSDDGGISWAEPVAVTSLGAALSTSEPRLDVAVDGRIHVAWTEWPVPSEGASERVSYAHSLDGGSTWSAPMEMGGFGHADGNVLALDDGTVYVAWNGGIAAGPEWGRNLRRSADGGMTWEEPIVFSKQIGRAGYPSLALDSAGTLQILTGDGEYASWQEGRMSSPRTLRPHLEMQTENSRMVIIHGSELLNVFFPYDWIVYFARCLLDVADVPTVLPPAAVSVPLSTSAPRDSLAIGATAAPPPTATGEAASAIGRPKVTVSYGVGVLPLLVGAGVSLMVVSMAAAWKVLRPER